ncbi:ABC transporter ATP-binding protein, partial [Paenibacillus tundrae]|nr:ABC transporter ATP-binding protein [Paenibacillus tundrae]
MNVTGFIGRLFRFRPFLFLINGLSWCIFHSLPLAIGIGMQWFFDRATAGSSDYMWLAAPLIFIALIRAV